MNKLYAKSNKIINSSMPSAIMCLPSACLQRIKMFMENTHQ